MLLLIRNYSDNTNTKKKKPKMFSFLIGFSLKTQYHNLKNYLGLKNEYICYFMEFRFFRNEKDKSQLFCLTEITEPCHSKACYCPLDIV